VASSASRGRGYGTTYDVRNDRVYLAMNDASRSSGSSLVLAFLTGAATGVVVALLTAPRPGRETRDRVRALAEDIVGRSARVPSALNEAYARAAKAARQAFVESLDAATLEQGTGADRRDH